MNRGHALYEDLNREHKRKEDEKRFITQQVIRRQSNATRGQFSNGFMDSMGAGIKPNFEGFTGTEELKKKANG